MRGNSHVPIGRSAEMEQPSTAAPNRTVIPAAASELAIQLGRNCRERRANLKLSQAELSVQTGLAASHLSHIENGRANPTLEVLAMIADALHCTVADLVREGDPG